MSTRTHTDEEIQDLTDRVFLLRDQLEQGKILFAHHLVDDFRRSCEAIRLRPDGLVDPATVDARVRGATLAIRAMRQREEAKGAISLAAIQDAYFTFLFQQLGPFYDQMKKAGATPSQAARALAKDDYFVRQTQQALPALAEQLREFWSEVSDAGAYHLQDGRQLKATFAGDLFPAHWENVVSTAGLYIDTIVLPCPVTRIAPLNGVLPKADVAAMFAKHTLTAMSYRDVATLDLTPPIACVVPNPDDFDRAQRGQELFRRAEPAMLKHAQHLFDRQFANLDDFREFSDSLKSIEQVMAELKRPERLLFDTQWGDRDPQAQLARALAERQRSIPGVDPSIAGHHVFASCLGRMPQALAAQENGLHFGGTPLINAETSWTYYTWFLEYEAAEAREVPAGQAAMHVVRALTAEVDNNLAWLGAVPPETVIEIRRNGQAEELRKLLGEGLANLIQARPDNYFRTADQVVENLDRAFREHQRKVLDARQKKLKLYGIDVTSLVATGAVAVTAALTGNPTLGAVSGLLGIAGLPNLKDIKSRIQNVVAEDRARRLSPTGLLFRHVQRKA